MITDEKIKDDIKQSDQEITNKILSYKKQYSPEELKSIVSLMEKPLSKIIIEKLLNDRSNFKSSIIKKKESRGS